jgi:hypothetical protein
MDQDEEQINHLREMIKKSRKLAEQSHVLRLRSEEVIGETETLLAKYYDDKYKDDRKKKPDENKGEGNQHQ